MCVMSMIIGHHMERFPNPNQFPVYDYGHYQELLRKAEAYDNMMQQKDCPDAVKDAWEKELEQIMLDKYGMKPRV